MLIGLAICELTAGIEVEGLHGDSDTSSHELDALYDFGKGHLQLAQKVPEELVGANRIVEDEIGRFGQRGSKTCVNLVLLLPLLFFESHSKDQVHS